MNVVATTERTSDLRGFAGIAGWGLLYVAARGLLELETLSWWTRVAIATAPVPVFAWVLWAISKGIARMDELQRRIQLEALALAFPLTVLMLMTLGLVELAVGLSADNWSYRHVWPFVILFYFAGLVRAKRRYE